MKRIIMLGIVLVTMLVSLGGCYPGYYPDHDRGEGRDRGERHDRDREPLPRRPEGAHDRNRADAGQARESAGRRLDRRAECRNHLRLLVGANLGRDDASLTALCEQAIRNYDPCISCATHFLTLEIEQG